MCQKIQKLSRNIKKQFLNIPVWYNSDITVNNHYVFIELWYQKGITLRVIGDFLDENGCFLKYYSFFERFCLLQENAKKLCSIIVLLHQFQNI